MMRYQYTETKSATVGTCGAPGSGVHRKLWAMAMVVLVAVLFSSAALAQAPPPSPYASRSFIGGLATDGTYQFNLANLSSEWVCPYCGYSTPYGDPANPPECPDPFSASGHPANVEMVPVPIGTDRAVRITSQDLGAGARDIEYTDETGTVSGGAAVIGKVYHPVDGPTTRRSILHTLTCDIVNADGADDIDANTHLRFFIMPPGVKRPCATQLDLDDIDSTTGGNLFDAGNPAADTYIEIGINPFRVENGDEWWVAYTKRDTGGTISQAQIRACSLMNGLDMNITDDSPSVTDNTYISNSGAVAITLHHDQFIMPPDTQETWLFHFTVQSNSRLLPGLTDMADQGEPNPGDITSLADLWPTDPKECWLNQGSGSATSGGIATDSTVAESGASLDPFEMQIDWTGVGMIAVQYANETTGGLQTDGDFRYFDGGAWQYDYQEDVTNAEIASQTTDNFRTGAGADSHQQYVQYIGPSRFYSSRVELYNDDEWEYGWDDGGTYRAYVNETFPRLIVGLQDIAGSWIQGLYGPGSRSDLRSFPLWNRMTDSPDRRYRCPFCGAIPVDAVGDPVETCPYHANDNDGEQISTGYSAELEMLQQPSAAGHIESAPNRPAARNVMPKDAVKFHDSGRWVGAHEDENGSAGHLYTHVDIPKHQPPSVPASDPNRLYENDITLDRGYRGAFITWDDDYDDYSGGDERGNQFDVLYRCPDCGYLQDHTGQCDNPSCDGHMVCPYCGAEYPDGHGADCDFCGGTLETISRTDDAAVTQQDIWAEEHTMGDLQVSVARQPDMSATTNSIQIGRAGAGVGTYEPDTTVQNLQNGFRAFPSDITDVSSLSVINEGNITSPICLGNVNDFMGPGASTVDHALPQYTRVELPAYDYQGARIAQGAPVTRDSMQTYEGAAGMATRKWNVEAPEIYKSSGESGNGYLRGGRSNKRLPLGQPAGTYTGQTLYFLDLSAPGSGGEGWLDFEDGGPGGTATNTGVAEFDPLADHPLEPVYAVVNGNLRNFAARLPHNDYYSMDATPVPLIDANNRIQSIWVTNRPSARGAGIGSTVPPGADKSDIPGSTGAHNLLYTTMTKAAQTTDDPLYRSYEWEMSGGEITDPYALSNWDTAGTITSSPWAEGDDAERWAFWHLRRAHPGGVESTLRFDESTAGDWSWDGSGAGEWVYTSSDPMENLRTFRDSDDEHWLFWHTGEEGQQQLMFRPNYIMGSTDVSDYRLAVSNRASRQWRADVFETIDPRDPTLNVGIRKPSQSPLTYAKDPSPFPEDENNDGSDDIVNVFYSAHVRSEGQADICWNRFDIGGMTGQDPNIPNYGKLAWPREAIFNGPWVNTEAGWREMPEEFKPNGLRQAFTSRHLDWIVHDNNAGNNFAESPQGPADPTSVSTDPGDGNNYIWRADIVDPVLCLGLIFDDPTDGNRPVARLYWLTWDEGSAEYHRDRGMYEGTAKLYPVDGVGAIPDPYATADGDGYLLNDPSRTGWQVNMEVNPALGSVTFSAPLFNVDRPDDRLAVFDNALTASVGGNDYPLVDVAIYGSYDPYIYRVTRSGANDDCPSAFYGLSSARRLTVFWRRSYPSSRPPHFGRSGFMHKSFTTAIQVAKPPLDGNPSVSERASDGASLSWTGIDLNSGVILYSPIHRGSAVNITYTSTVDGQQHRERHEIPGWTKEMPVPVRTNGSEGRLVVKPEVYNTSYELPDGSTASTDVVRYWLFWTSLGTVYDMRLLNVTNPGTTPNAVGTRQVINGDPEPIFMQSADVYTSVFAPEFGPTMRERQTPVVTFDPS